MFVYFFAAAELSLLSPLAVSVAVTDPETGSSDAKQDTGENKIASERAQITRANLDL
jgi:hypothetical protein